jgi:hypothetical protein
MTRRGVRVTATKLGTQSYGCASTQKKCEACGEMFDGPAPEHGCWCEDVKLASESALQLRARYSECMGPRCLAAAAGRSM